VWREADIGGVFFSPLVVYMVVALLIWLPIRWGLERLRLTRWIWNTPLAEAGLFVCILGALVAFL
jgi:hypothetical protein